MTSILVAFYFSLIVLEREWPVVVGPYELWSDCASVREFLDRRGYETVECGLMIVPQEDDVLLQVGDIPNVKEP